MIFEHLRLDLQEGILIVTLDRESALNAINMATMDSLHRLFGQYIPDHDEITGVVLTGAGPKAFAAGADIKEFAEFSAQEGKHLSAKGHETYFLIEKSRVPVIAAVNGYALGGGCELAMACHMRIAGEHAKFGQPEVNLGLIPGYGGTQRLIQYIGKGKALELLLTADLINAEEALRLGLVNHVVPSGQEVETSRKLLLRISEKGPVAVRKVIEAVNAYFTEATDGFHFEVESFGYACGTQDFREGASAFVEKRKPQFTGH
ncbi:MAG: enoyl-CoA hydratase/isomerase family protein [Saprospiraceae bacterium]|nr:enoyl-CoA hydratase/isomerase family protein [Saprospiraceae bacterium]